MISVEVLLGLLLLIELPILALAIARHRQIEASRNEPKMITGFRYPRFRADEVLVQDGTTLYTEAQYERRRHIQLHGWNRGSVFPLRLPDDQEPR